MTMHDLTFPELNQAVSKEYPGFCLGITEELIRLVHGLPVSGKWHAFAVVYDPAASFLRAKMDEFGFVDGEAKKNSLEANPRVAFLRDLYRVLGVAYNVPPMIHHGSDIQAKEGMLNLLYSIHHAMLGNETACLVMGKRRLDVSPVGTRDQIVYDTKERKYYFPKRIFEPQS
jgi:hypothetical protein